MSRVGRCWSSVITTVSRTKTIDIDRLQETELRRCLTVFDLIALGVGNTLGAGIYILAGQVTKTQTGPAIIFSFLIAALASFLAGLCYAEFAARVPRAGSAYVYSYVSVGELWAFIIGWNLILENMIGAASAGKAWSQYFDSIINDTIRRSIETNVGNITFPGMDSHPDFLAMGLLIVATLLVCLGVKMSSAINLVFTVINLAVIVCIIGVGCFYADINNWTRSPGGFFPFHFRGVIAGAATCFYAFIGFDTIASSGEEATVPTKHLPIAIIATLIVSLVAYLGVSAILTLLVPWNQLADTAALAKAFAQVGVPGAEYVIAVGALCGLTSSMMGSIFPLPRAVYSMSQDGLIFRWLGYVNVLTGTPVIATCLSGLLVALCALVFDLEALVQMMSIGTLMAYALVSVSILVLHYQAQQVGLTASDHVTSCDLVNGTHSSHTTSTDTLTPATPGLPPGLQSGLPVAGVGGRATNSRMSVSEDTGLLRVGDSNRVRYVPANTTTVVKRIKPPTDEDDEDQSRSDPQAPPTAAPPTVPPPAAVASEPSVVEAYRAKVAAEKQEQRHLESSTELQQQRPLATSDGNNYKRFDCDSSIDNLSQLFNTGDDLTHRPTERTRRIVILCLCAISMVWTVLCIITVYGEENLAHADWWAVTLSTCCVIVLISLVCLLVRQPRNDTQLHFKTPLVPWLPLASVLINIYLMVTLSSATWIRFAVWMSLGMIIYVCYGAWHSNERRPVDESEVILYNVADKDSLIVDAVYR